MTKKDIHILDDAIQYLCKKQDRIVITRQVLGINTDYDFLREVQTIEMLFEGLLEDRKNIKSTFLFRSTSGWTVQYFRDNKKYEKGENYYLNIYFSFVEMDTFD
jgi:predicted transcriptional regulator